MPIPKALSPGEVEFANHLRFHGLENQLVREYKFCPGRNFRFDFAFTQRKIAVEIEGGTRGKGAHNTHAGYTKDCRKYNLAAIMGWQVYRFTTEMVHSAEAIDFIISVLSEKAA